jgi:hypothetical protein
VRALQGSGGGLQDLATGADGFYGHCMSVHIDFRIHSSQRGYIWQTAEVLSRCSGQVL